MATAIVDKIGGLGGSIAQKGQGMLDSIFPPEKRAELLARIKAFVLKNPKISSFLLTNLALSGGPLALFILFSISIFVFALIVALVVALLAAVVFTLIAVGFALIILFPTVLFTTLVATFIFLWGLGGYYLFKYMNKQSAPGAKGDTIGDKLNGLTGGNLNFVMDNARQGWIEKQLGSKQDEWKAPSPHHAPAQKNQESNSTPNGTPNGTPKKPAQKHSEDKDSGTTSGADVTKHAATGVNGAKSGANGVKKVANPDHVTNGVGNATKAAGVGDHADKVKGAPKKLASAPGNIKGTAVGTLGGATGLA